MTNRVQRDDLLEHVAREDPSLAVTARCDRCRALVVVEQGDLTKPDHLGVLTAIDDEIFLESYFLVDLWVRWVRSRLVDCDAHRARGKDEVLGAHVSVADHDLALAEIARKHGIGQDLVVLGVDIFRQEAIRK